LCHRRLDCIMNSHIKAHGKWDAEFQVPKGEL
jgi:hypothetical protein